MQKYSTRTLFSRRMVCALLSGLCVSGTTAFAGANQNPDLAIRSLQTPAFHLSLQKSSQTLVSLAPKGAEQGFDFAPAWKFPKRLADGAYRLGDMDLRLRFSGDAAWQDFSTAFHRVPVKALAETPDVLAAADISATFSDPQHTAFPLTVTRRWKLEQGKLVLQFTLHNPTGKTVEIGGLGLPMIFDNIVSGRTLDQAHEHAVFYDPYTGMDGGYLQVTRLNGHGPALLVLPQKNTPFQLYKPILSSRKGRTQIYHDPEPRNMTFEGFYDWMVTAKGFADTDWKGVREWNKPTSLTLKPGESRTIGLKFVVAPSIRKIDDTLIKNNRPLAVGIPGYVVPTDMPASLYLHATQRVSRMETFPEGGVSVSAPEAVKDGWVRYQVTGKIHGRVRLCLHYTDGSEQTIFYRVTKPEPQVVADFGHFLATKQFYSKPGDLFHRSPGYLGFDRETGHMITQDSRVWVAGLSDEGGAGSWLAAIMKELNNPVPSEVAKFESFANQTLWGQIQESSGPGKFGVHKSIFYYDPKHMPPGTYDPKLDWSTWTSWSKKDAADLGRSYNYPHVAAAWWTLYRLARFHPGMTHGESWQTYLMRAAGTIEGMMKLAPYYTQFGQMEGDVFVYILEDLRAEGMTAEADKISALMKKRVDHWMTEKYPFGSEMPWDSTGQAEVYMWMRYFHHQKQADATREVILGYDPAIPNWGYNGSARRFWDFLYAGKFSRIERQLHHYGSSINAIPLFDAYRANPEDFHLLQVAYGGLMGSLTNIDDKGFAGSAFHSFPDKMAFDAMSGDYGMSFYGHAVETSSYLVKHPTFGWVGFGGTVQETGQGITMVPKDSGQNRVFIAPAGLWLTLPAGKVKSVNFSPDTGKVILTLAPKSPYTSKAYLDVQTTTENGRVYRVSAGADAQKVRGLYQISLHEAPTQLVLTPTD